MDESERSEAPVQARQLKVWLCACPPARILSKAILRMTKTPRSYSGLYAGMEETIGTSSSILNTSHSARSEVNRPALEQIEWRNEYYFSQTKW